MRIVIQRQPIGSIGRNGTKLDGRRVYLGENGPNQLQIILAFAASIISDGSDQIEV